MLPASVDINYVQQYKQVEISMKTADVCLQQFVCLHCLASSLAFCVACSFVPEVDNCHDKQMLPSVAASADL